jgi:hypothetical protein
MTRRECLIGVDSDTRDFLERIGGSRAVTEANLRMAHESVTCALHSVGFDLIEGKPRWDRESRKIRFAIWLAAWRDLRLNCSTTQKAPLLIVETNELQRLQF